MTKLHDEVIANFNLKVNKFLKISFVYDFQRQWTFVVQALTSACVCSCKQSKTELQKCYARRRCPYSSGTLGNINHHLALVLHLI